MPFSMFKIAASAEIEIDPKRFGKQLLI